MINNDDLKRYIISGATLTADLQPVKIKTGFMVSKIGYEKTHKPSDIDGIKADILTYKHLLKRGEFIGLWFFEGKVYIDISRHYKHKRDAIKSGIKNKQYSIYNLANGEEIPLTKKTYILYQYNGIKNDIKYIKEYTTREEMTRDLKMNYHTLSQYIINSIDDPIKSLINNKYLLISNEVYYRELEEI